MIRIILILFCRIILTYGLHFNGGTIRWEAMDPYTTSSPVAVTIIQTYGWTYPKILCTNNVPITTPGRSGANKNLTCTVDCTSDGGYSAKPVNILTDCVSSSTALSMMTSKRSVNISLTAGAHFYVSYQDTAWTPLNSPPVSSLSWSITALIDLRLRPDGFINTPPEAVVASPQYAIVNRTTDIDIPVSDANAGDDIRCRWSVNTPGYRRRREENKGDTFQHQPAFNTHRDFEVNERGSHNRVKRRTRADPCDVRCVSQCKNKCPCRCSSCSATNCTGLTCVAPGSTCASVTTTLETPGTLPTTSVYLHRQAINECGGICYPTSVPSGTTLSGCTLSFKGLIPNTWYAVAIQVSEGLASTLV